MEIVLKNCILFLSDLTDLSDLLIEKNLDCYPENYQPVLSYLQKEILVIWGDLWSALKVLSVAGRVIHVNTV